MFPNLFYASSLATIHNCIKIVFLQGLYTILKSYKRDNSSFNLIKFANDYIDMELEE